MMKIKKEKPWFDEIPQPKVASTLSESADYLDRLIGKGGGGITAQKQYFIQPKRENNNNFNNNKRKEQQNQRQYNQNKKPNIQNEVESNSTKSFKFDVDDVRWLEERRKKFPKVDGTHQKSPETSISNLNNSTDSPIEDTKPTYSQHKRNSNLKQPQQRKKTLFEMLMD